MKNQTIIKMQNKYNHLPFFFLWGKNVFSNKTECNVFSLLSFIPLFVFTLSDGFFHSLAIWASALPLE